MFFVFALKRDWYSNGGMRPLTESLMFEPDHLKMKTMTFNRFIEILLKRPPGHREKTKEWITPPTNQSKIIDVKNQVNKIMETLPQFII